MYATNKREPLGRAPFRGSAPPSVLSSRSSYGVTTNESESAKNLIYPTGIVTAPEFEEQYKKSHSSFAPGEQRTRDYNWAQVGIKDPKQHRYVGALVEKMCNSILV